MINKLQRIQLMKLLSVYYQNEDVAVQEKKSISDALLASDNVDLHNRLLALKPKSDIGFRIRIQIIKKLEEYL